MGEIVKILHNPRCSKSRQTLELVRQQGIEPQVIEYLNTPPSESELAAIVQALGIGVEDLVRKGEAIYKERYKGKTLDREEWIAALVANPILIERPIVINGDRARIGRPPESVLEIL